MAWTYDATIPTDMDAVRLAIGDTDSTDPQLQDGEILYLLSQQPAVLNAAITACNRLAAKYARKATTKSQDRLQDWNAVSKHYAALAASIRNDILTSAIGSIALVYAGGLSVDEHVQDSVNIDLVQPAFTKHQYEKPGTEILSGFDGTASMDSFFNP